MRPGLRTAGAIIAGVVAAYVVIIVVEIATSRLFPMPAGAGVGNAEAMRAWIQQLPAAAFALVLCGWICGAFAGGFVTTRVERESVGGHAIIVGAALLAASVLNMIRIPHPIWMWVGAFLFIVPAAYAGARVSATSAHRAEPRLT